MRVSDLAISVERAGRRTVVRCVGELDVSTCRELRQVLRETLSEDLDTLTLDCSGLSILTAAGIKCLVEAELACRNKGVELDMSLSQEARKVLDVVGLWWLGVVKDGISVELALEQALRRYGDREFAEPADRGEYH